MLWDTKVERLTQTAGSQGRPSGGSDVYNSDWKDKWESARQRGAWKRVSGRGNRMCDCVVVREKEEFSKN